MIKNYFKILIRIVKRQHAFSLINTFGLAIGMAAFVLIFLWVKNELSYDKFHKNGENIYRIVTEWKKSGDKTAGTPGLLMEELKTQLPEVQYAARIHASSDQSFYKHGDKSFYENQVAYVDPDLFRMFSFPAVKGDTSQWFEPVSALVITESIEEKYFGEESGIGKSLVWNNRNDDIITGVVRDFPDNSHLQFRFFYSHNELSKYWRGGYSWTNFVHNTYVQLKPGTDIAATGDKITNILFENAPEAREEVARMYLQPLHSVYLDSEIGSGVVAVQGNIQYIRIFSAVGIAILLIACINFINLSTARAGKRAREVGVRKTLGANRRQLAFQFFAESLLLSLVAFVVAMLLVEMILPYYNTLINKNITVDYFDPQLITGFLLLVLITGAVSGVYPALLLSSFQTVSVLKGRLLSNEKGGVLRKVLVVVQFFVSILLIIGSVVVYNQLEYIRSKNLGFEKDNLVYIPAQENIGKHFEAVRQELLQSPNIIGVTAKESVPTMQLNNSYVDWPGKEENVNYAMEIAAVDYNFMDVMNVTLTQGRNFSREHKTDVKQAFIINEKAAETMGLEDAPGTEISTMGRKGTIIGVIKDVNFRSLHQPVEPQVFYMLEDYQNTLMRLFGVVLIRIKGNQYQQAIEDIRQVVQKHNPEVPFEYHFLDETMEKQYAFENSLSRISASFSGLAILVSCLGLLGLISFTTEQKQKELSIRKVLGASPFHLMRGLLRNFVFLILLAWLLAAPFGYFFSKKWLSTFAYHIEVSPGVFAMAGIAALLITLLITGTHVLKAVRANPVDALKQE